ncbi:synapsin-1-like [Meriones unguiculatus]|uniref:synapsin-1-like n=1 Tax=Meriones unguiculatus TaxID=10047 RepID=UPI00293F49E1|nr:synapsin-1-like [Meriones unguiculatus]
MLDQRGQEPRMHSEREPGGLRWDQASTGPPGILRPRQVGTELQVPDTEGPSGGGKSPQQGKLSHEGHGDSPIPWGGDKSPRSRAGSSVQSVTAALQRGDGCGSPPVTATPPPRARPPTAPEQATRPHPARLRAPPPGTGTWPQPPAALGTRCHLPGGTRLPSSPASRGSRDGSLALSPIRKRLGRSRWRAPLPSGGWRGGAVPGRNAVSW